MHYEKSLKIKKSKYAHYNLGISKLNIIDKIESLHLQGGEPLQIPQHWQLLMEDISDADAKNIR